MNAWVGQFPGQWLVYSEKVKSAAIYIRDSSLVPDLALLLFGGRLEKVSADDAAAARPFSGGGGASAGAGGSIAMLGGWANFNTEGGVAELVLGLRARLDALLQVLLN